PGPLASTPAVVGSVVYVDSGTDETGATLQARAVTTGKLLWSASHTPGSGFFRSHPAVGEGKVFVGSGTDAFDRSGAVFAFDADTGHRIWRGTVQGSGASSPIVANGVVWVATFTGTLYAFDADCAGPVCNPIFAAPALDENTNLAPAVADGT